MTTKNNQAINRDLSVKVYVIKTVLALVGLTGIIIGLPIIITSML